MSRRLRATLGRTDDAGAVRVGLGEQALPLGGGVGLDQSRSRSLLRAGPGVAALLGDQVLLAHGELEPVGQLVLGDRPLALDGKGPPLEGGLVGVALRLLTGRRLQDCLLYTSPSP